MRNYPNRRRDPPPTKTALESAAHTLFSSTVPPAGGLTVVYSDELLRTVGTPALPANWFEQFLRYQLSTGDRLGAPRHIRSAAFVMRFAPRERPNALSERRAIACRSFNNSAWSVTVRGDQATDVSELSPRSVRLDAFNDLQGYAPPAKRASSFAFTLADIVDTIFSVWLGRERLSGLAIVTGATSVGQSAVARGLVHRSIRHLISQGVRPHLLTFEEPIERWLRPHDESFAQNDRSAEKRIPRSSSVDYTPRTVGSGGDCPSLEEGLRDALRQDPSVVFVGEIRSKSELKACLDFAATGRLLISTTHSGSVADAMGDILDAADAETPNARLAVSQRLLSIVHLAALRRLHRGVTTVATVPSIWIHTPRAVRAMAVDGFASLLPGDSEAASCLGRRYVLKLLIDRLPRPLPEKLTRLLTTATLEDDVRHDPSPERHSSYRVARLEPSGDTQQPLSLPTSPTKQKPNRRKRKNRLQIFLCHSSRDKTAARDLFRRLREAGFDPWLDEEKLLPGQIWEQEIAVAVRTSDVVAVCLSSTSLDRAGYVHKEVRLALDAADERPEGTPFIIPVRLENCAVPARLSRWQWVDMFDGQGFYRLVKALRNMQKGLGRTTPS